MKIKFIENDESQGIDYDWKLILKEYKKLGVPSEFDYSDVIPFDSNLKWHILLSTKSVGKTTVLLLIGLIMYKLYGTQTQIVRHRNANAGFYDRLYQVICTFNDGQYMKRLFGDKYNTIKYFQRNFYLANYKDGKTVKSEEKIAVALSSDDCYNLCSKYDAPRGDLIILDECFTDENTPEEFIHFINLHKTIVRDRMSDKIFILGNNYDANNIWFRQLTIANDIRKVKMGDNKILYTNMHMPIYVNFLTPRSGEKRKRFNKNHYGFDNSELNAITGLGDWSIKEYPQICELKNRETLCRGVYFNFMDDQFMEGEFMQADGGIFFAVHPANPFRAKRGTLVYVMRQPCADNEIYFFNDRLACRIKEMIANLRIVFSDNQTGDLFSKFIKETS